MILDTSAMVAILFDEPERERYLDAIEASDDVLLSAASYVELAIIVDRRADVLLSRRLDELLAALGVEIVDLDAEQSRQARRAYAEYGRGSGSSARLNLGDCFTYALAAVRGQPLLFKGDDFVHTDLEPAVS